jgi:DNA-binding transcriptional regulator YdaS (Cro superfamily)
MDILTFKRKLSEVGWSQAKFARMAGIHPNAVSGWVTGKAKVPEWAGCILRFALALKQCGEIAK